MKYELKPGNEATVKLADGTELYLQVAADGSWLTASANRKGYDLVVQPGGMDHVHVYAARTGRTR